MFRNIQCSVLGEDQLNGKTGDNPQQYRCCRYQHLVFFAPGCCNRDNVQIAFVSHDDVLLIMFEQLLAHQCFRLFIQRIREQIY